MKGFILWPKKARDVIYIFCWPYRKILNKFQKKVLGTYYHVLNGQINDQNDIFQALALKIQPIRQNCLFWG